MQMTKTLWVVDVSTAKKDRIIYRAWQLELFLFSMIEKGGISAEDICVACYVENEEFALPKYYEKIFSLYPGLKVVFSIDIGFSPLYDTMDRGVEDYCPLNKASALIPVYKRGYHKHYDMVALMDLDCYMYGKANFDAYPTQTTLTDYNGVDPEKVCFLTSGLQGQEQFVAADHLMDIWGNPWNGIDMIKIMEAIRVPKANIEKVKRGSYNIFLASEDVTEELVHGFQYFTVAIKALCAAAGHPFVWQAEMSAYPLALASYGIDYETTNNIELSDTPFHSKDIPEGTLCTYAFENFSADSGSTFNKLNYMNSTPFEDKKLIEQGIHFSNTEAERSFYLYCQEIPLKTQIEREL
jgi:hypothetical protein